MATTSRRAAAPRPRAAAPGAATPRAAAPGATPRAATPRAAARAAAPGAAATPPLSARERARIADLVARLAAAYPGATTELVFRDAYQLLCATILSAQCTDVRVNQVTPALFARYPDARALAAAEPAELEAIIRPTGFFRNKAASLRGMAQGLRDRFGGEVPRTMAELVTLPGVARKTANVVLGTAFGVAEGIAVDTHVRRLAQRLALSAADVPEVIERDLMARVPRERWTELSHTLILHGRRVCAARTPACERCSLRDLCPSASPGRDAAPPPAAPRAPSRARARRG